jgi:hypothetical protein
MFAQISSFGARRVAVVVLAAGLVGVVAVPTILAASSPPAPSPVLETSLAAPDAAARGGRLLRGDATFLKRDGTTAAVHFERGEVTAASATSVTIKGADGMSATFAVTPTTRVRAERKKATADALKVGQLVVALGTKSGSGYDALLIRVRPAKPAN